MADNDKNIIPVFSPELLGFAEMAATEIVNLVFDEIEKEENEHSETEADILEINQNKND